MTLDTILSYVFSMTWFSWFLVYVLVWWGVLFCLLPVGVQTPEEPGHGHAAGAPAQANIRQKFKWATLAAIPVTVVVMGLIKWWPE